MKERNPPKFLLLFLNQVMWWSFLSCLSLLKKKKRREEKVYFPRYVSPKAVAYDSELDDEPMPITYISDHDWEEHTTFDIENLFGVDYENDEMLTNENTLEDNYPIAYDDTMPPVFDNYYRDCYDLGY